jgi:hypothetical protein
MKRSSGWSGGLLGTQTGVLFAIDLAMMIALTIVTPVFISPANLLAVGVAISGNVLASIGSSLVLLTGGFDLSIGSSYGLAGIVVSHALLAGIPVIPAMALALLSGALLGVLNGLTVTKLRVNPFITTLGTMTIGRGLINIFTKGYSISGLPDSFMALLSLKILGLPPSVAVMILATVAADLLLRRWRPARQLCSADWDQRGPGDNLGLHPLRAHRRRRRASLHHANRGRFAAGWNRAGDARPHRPFPGRGRIRRSGNDSWGILGRHPVGSHFQRHPAAGNRGQIPERHHRRIPDRCSLDRRGPSPRHERGPTSRKEVRLKLEMGFPTLLERLRNEGKEMER